MSVLGSLSTTGAIDTRLTLLNAVSSWMHRTDLDDILPSALALVEARIRRDVRCRAMEATASGTLTSQLLDVPARFAEMRQFLIDDEVQNYITPEQWQAKRDSTNNQYTVIGDVFHVQLSTGDYQIDYVQWFAPLVDDNDSNWLLTYHPDVYLFGVLAEVAAYVEKNPAVFASRYQAAVQEVRRVENEARFPGRLTVRVG